MTDKTNELKPCPFCGTEPDKINSYRVQCVNNRCGNYIKLMNVQDWNRRIRSAAAELRWIPVSERLPKQSGVYDVTLYDGTISKSAFYVGAFDKSVIAWMPPPAKPYTEPADNIAEVGEREGV